MPSTPTSKQEKPPSASGNAFEMQSYGGEAVASRLNGKTVEAVLVEEDEAKRKGATANDCHDMDRLGKKQELRVSFRFLLWISDLLEF